MLEPGLDRLAFTQAYNKIVAAYANHLPCGTALNPPLPLFLQPEAFDACWAAECQRQFWKPEASRLTLVAESHVFTDADDLTAAIRTELLPPEASSVPTQFVRLIYCLGYGDNSILSYAPKQSNEHTNFWDILAECAGMVPPGCGGEPFKPFWESHSVGMKLKILQKLKERGIWLADASIHACMNPRFPYSRNRGDGALRDKRRNIECFPKLYREVVNASWAYVRNTIAGVPTTWIIGKCVRDTVEDPSLDKSRWFYQPGAGLNDAAKKIQKLQLARFRSDIANL